ncbi:MAG: MlaD family protein [Balneolales bacterium]|nr:MlaD family protein [Balneolales bacterium]
MNNEIKVVITIFIAIVVGIIGYRFMSEIPLFSQTYELHATFDRVDGLVTGSAVLMQGVKVGTVRRISFTDNDSLRVDMSFSFGRKLNEGSVAYIRTVQLVDKAIEIERSSSSAMLESGSGIKGVYDDGLLGALSELSERAAPSVEQSVESLSSVLSQVDSMLLEGGRDDIAATLSSLNQSVEAIRQVLAARAGEIDESILLIRNTLQNMEGITSGQEEKIEQILANLETSSNELNVVVKDAGELTRELSEIMKKVNEGEGSLGRLVNDPSLYNNLDSLSYNLNELIKNFNDNPRHFLKHMRLIDIF